MPVWQREGEMGVVQIQGLEDSFLPETQEGRRCEVGLAVKKDAGEPRKGGSPWWPG